MVELSEEQIDQLVFTVHKIVKILSDKIEKVEVILPNKEIKVTGYWVGDMMRIDIKL